MDNKKRGSLVIDLWRVEWENTKQSLKFWINILLGDFINIFILLIIIGIWIYLLFGSRISFQLDKLDNLIFWILVSILIPTFTGFLRYFSKYDQTLQEFYKDASIMIFIEKIISLFQNFISTKDTLKLGVIKTVCDKFSDDFGGIVIGADEKQYIERLNRLVPLSDESFYATLRGGYRPEYTIRWFFQDSKATGGAIILPWGEKQNYLKKVNTAPIRKKIRIIILKEDEMGDFCNDKWRDGFFHLNTQVEVYRINPDSLIKNLVEGNISIELEKGARVSINHKGETFFIWEDYAVFDQRIVVKHNGQNSLYFGVENQINKMLLPFELVQRNPELFEKMDQKGIYEYNNDLNCWELRKDWIQWKREYLMLILIGIRDGMIDNVKELAQFGALETLKQLCETNIDLNKEFEVEWIELISWISDKKKAIKEKI